MKKIINGRMYNTETAVKIGYKDNGLSLCDLDFECKTLYRKSTREYFFLIEGGARSSAATMDGDNMAPGWYIEPLKECVAREWVEENLSTEAYIKEFGEVPE